MGKAHLAPIPLTGNLSHPIPSHRHRWYPIPSHLTPSHPNPSHTIPSHNIPYHPISSHPIPSHPSSGETLPIGIMLGAFDVGIPGLFRILEVGVIPAWTRNGRADAVDVMKLLFVCLLDHVVETTSEWPLTIELANVACFNGSLGKRWQEIFQSVEHDRRLFKHLKVSFFIAKKSRMQQTPGSWPSLLLEQGTSGNVADSEATATRAGGSGCSEESAIVEGERGDVSTDVVEAGVTTYYLLLTVLLRTTYYILLALPVLTHALPILISTTCGALPCALLR